MKNSNKRMVAAAAPRERFHEACVALLVRSESIETERISSQRLLPTGNDCGSHWFFGVFEAHYHQMLGQKQWRKCIMASR